LWLDEVIDWHQGIEMYGTMRRTQKPHIKLVRANENYGLVKNKTITRKGKRRF